MENGAKVLVCEKTAQVNGRGGVVGACNSRLNKDLGCEIEPVAVAWSIFDSNFGADTADSLNYGGGMFWDTMSRQVGQEFDPQQIVDLVEGEAAAGKDVLGNETAVTAWKCDTLEELADAIGVDKDSFLAQVERYNEMCEAGEPIPGLYAIGNTSGDLYAVDYPINMPGNSNGRCLTWGWLVGKTVAADLA